MTKVSQFEHTQRFVCEIFAERLRENGFCSYKNEGIHWYRLVNNEVVHAIYFITRHTAIPVSLEIKYGCHPLFIPPVFQKSPYLYAERCSEQMYDVIPETVPGSTPCGFQKSMILGCKNRLYRVPDVLVECPQNEHKGLDILERVLEVLEGIKTPLACYEAHKKWRKQQIENECWLVCSPYFVDEVLYWEDKPLYPYCQKYIDGMIQYLETVKQAGKRIRKEDQANLDRLLILKRVFAEEDWETYLQTFQDREQETLHLLDKYTMICR